MDLGTIPATSHATFWRQLELQNDLELAARTDLPVLITAEPGYAVKPVAFWIHSRSGRRRTALAVVDAASTTPRQAWSVFERAARSPVESGRDRHVTGTVLLANVDELRPQMQEELLRFLDLRNTAGRPLIRVIAATYDSAFASVQAQRLRKDLFYRLNAIHIMLTSAATGRSRQRVAHEPVAVLRRN
jgi:transcriptional regulator, propionate catabolism operon regulatory protein